MKVGLSEGYTFQILQHMRKWLFQSEHKLPHSHSVNEYVYTSIVISPRSGDTLSRGTYAAQPTFSHECYNDRHIRNLVLDYRKAVRQHCHHLTGVLIVNWIDNLRAMMQPTMLSAYGTAS